MEVVYHYINHHWELFWLELNRSFIAKLIAKYFLIRVARQEVPATSVSWDVDFVGYDPAVFDADHLKGAPYADPMLGSPDFDPKFNQIDGKMNRRSHEGSYKVSFLFRYLKWYAVWNILNRFSFLCFWIHK